MLTFPIPLVADVCSTPANDAATGKPDVSAYLARKAAQPVTPLPAGIDSLVGGATVKSRVRHSIAAGDTEAEALRLALLFVSMDFAKHIVREYVRAQYAARGAK